MCQVSGHAPKWKASFEKLFRRLAVLKAGSVSKAYS